MPGYGLGAGESDLGGDASSLWNSGEFHGNGGASAGKQALETTNLFGDLYGAVSGGKKDPIQEALDGGTDYGAIPWANGDQMVFGQMDEQQWKELGGLRVGAQQEWIAKRKQELLSGTGRPPGQFFNPKTGQTYNRPGSGPGVDPAVQKQQADEAAFQKWRNDTMTRLDAFSKEMNMPVDQLIAKGDLGVMNAGAQGRAQAGSAAYGAGLGGGGISAMNTQRAVTDAQSQYQLQRAGLGLQATNSLLGNMSDMAHAGEDTRRYEQGMNMQLQQANEQARQMRFAQGQQQAGQKVGILGGVFGGLFGGPAGASAGYNLGSGLGQSQYGTYRPNQLQYPKGSSYPGSGSGGLGGAQ